MDTTFENRYHRDRYPATVESDPTGVAKASDFISTRPSCPTDPTGPPLKVKLRDANTETMAFATTIGMRTFLHCPVPTVDPTDPRVRTFGTCGAGLGSVAERSVPRACR